MSELASAPQKPQAADSAAPLPSDAQAQQTAEAVRDAMTARDKVFQAMGMQVIQVAPGSATLTMTVRADMLNGHAICHGGLITTLADTAFAYACNSRNALTVASSITIDLLQPAHEGDRLSAHCRQQHGGGRMGIYDCEVTDQNGRRIALFRGHSYAMKGRTVIDALPSQGAGMAD